MPQILVLSAVESFINSLEEITIAKTLKTIELLEKFGYQLSFPHSQKIRPHLYELRIKGKQEARIFYTICDQQITLLHGFVKKTNQTPTREIDTALKRLDCL